MHTFLRTVTRAFVAAAFALLAGQVALAQDAAGDDFLKLVDARKYGESWDLGSDYLKQSVSRGEWTTQLVKTRDTIGDVTSRRLKSSLLQQSPAGAPAGDYLVQTYETVFASQGAAKVETLPLVKDADGRWRAVGYFVR